MRSLWYKYSYKHSALHGILICARETEQIGLMYNISIFKLYIDILVYVKIMLLTKCLIPY